MMAAKISASNFAEHHLTNLLANDNAVHIVDIVPPGKLPHTEPIPI